MKKWLLLVGLVVLLGAGAYVVWLTRRAPAPEFVDFGKFIPTDLVPASGQVAEISSGSILLTFDDPSAAVPVTQRRFSFNEYSNIIITLRSPPPLPSPSTEALPYAPTIVGTIQDVPVGSFVTVMFSAAESASAEPVAWQLYAPEP